MGRTRDSFFWNAFVEQAATAVEAARLLPELLDHLDIAEEYARRIKDLEHQGDKITHEVLNTLHKTWITPLDREEIHALVYTLDDVLDLIDVAAKEISLYGVTDAPSEARELVTVVIAAAEGVRRGVEALPKLKDRERILALCVEINRQENLGDEIYRRAVARLFREGTDPLHVMKWRDIFDSLERATDKCEDVANILEGIVLEHS